MRSGFFLCLDLNHIHEILSFFMRDNHFTLRAGTNGCIISRSTAIKLDYKGIVLIYNPIIERL